MLTRGIQKQHQQPPRIATHGPSVSVSVSQACSKSHSRGRCGTRLEHWSYPSEIHNRVCQCICLARVSIALSWPQKAQEVKVKTTETEDLESSPILGLWAYTNPVAKHILSNIGESAMQMQEAVTVLATITPYLFLKIHPGG